MDRWFQRSAAALGAALLLTGCAAPGGSAAPAQPVKVTVWTYYNGAQLTAFNALVDEFNTTVGKEKNIVVESTSQGTVSDLAAEVMAAANGEVGAQELPDIFSAYADTAYQLDQMGLAAGLDDYLTDEEKALYVDGFLESGRIDGELKVFPVAKSVEIMALNETDWNAFAEATGASLDALATVEGVTETAQAYYEWTDSLTPEPNDGEAMFGRDAMANFFFAGSEQLGVDPITFEDGQPVLNFDHDAVRRLWDNYYIPFIKGYFTAEGRFRNDDLKTGAIIACVCSSSGATFLPSEVSNDVRSYPIEMKILPCPQFAGGQPYAIEQGAGMVVTKGTDAEIAASVEFLKWFTDGARSIHFSSDSGYLPVTKEAYSAEAVNESGVELPETMREVLTTAMETVKDNSLYAMPAFETANSLRGALETVMSDQAAADREQVRSALDAGETLEQATAPFVSDEYFETWYAAALETLNGRLAG